MASDYTIRFQSKLYQIQQAGIRDGLRGGTMRVEKRLDGTPAETGTLAQSALPRKSNWMKNFQVGKNDVRRKTSMR